MDAEHAQIKKLRQDLQISSSSVASLTSANKLDFDWRSHWEIVEVDAYVGDVLSTPSPFYVKEGFGDVGDC